jgi:uncharacterized protein YkwD
MTPSKVAVIIAQVFALCACAANNGGVKVDDVSVTAVEDDANCVHENPDFTGVIKQQLEEVCRLTNRARAAQGLQPLKLEIGRSEVAQAHAEDMWARSFFDHVNPDGKDPFDRLNDRSLTYRAAGENIAYGQTTAQQVVDSWMASTGHRTNILNPKFVKLGLGLSNNRWVQVFTD